MEVPVQADEDEGEVTEIAKPVLHESEVRAPIVEVESIDTEQLAIGGL